MSKDDNNEDERHRKTEQNIIDYFRDRQAKIQKDNAATEKHRRQQRIEDFREIGRGIGEALAASPPSDVIAAIVKKVAALGD